MGGTPENVHGVGSERVRRECELLFCTRPVRSSGATLCEGHYYQRRRGKQFTPLLPARIEGTQCAIDGCDKDRHGQYCSMHTARIKRHGDPDVVIHQRDRAIPKGAVHPNWTGADATYNAVHFRLRNERGKAADHPCFYCGGDAKQWALIHDRGKSLFSHEGPYSVDLMDYEAMCVPCHKAMDLARIKE